MTAIERVQRTQRLLGGAAILRALAWGVAVTLLVLAVISFSSLAIDRLRGDDTTAVIAAVAIGLGVALGQLWKARRVVSTRRVALWIEERIPALEYSLVTAVEGDNSPFRAGMEANVARQNVGAVALKSIRRGVLSAAAALVLAALLLYVSPSGALGRSAGYSRRGGAATGLAAANRSNLREIRALVTAPAYAGGRTTTLDDPPDIPGLPGSRIEIRGKGSGAGLSAGWDASAPGSPRLAATSRLAPLSVRTASRGEWVVSLAMPPKAALVALKEDSADRLIVLRPLADAQPKVVLTSPRRDTTLRTPRLVVQLDANVSDDIGLTTGYLEYLITTGSGEIFKSRTINTPVVHFNGSRTGSLSATLDLASLKLGEGDVLSMRAVAQDGNTVSGPGIGTSDTRTIRIARAGEYDSLSIEAAAPPPLDSSAVSQRMLIAMTEKLVREQPGIAREELVKRSTEIGDLEDRIRKRVQDILTEAEGAGEDVAEPQPGDPAPTIEEMESPDVISGAKNPDLKAAYSALWQAVRSLNIAEPAPALPPMRVALAALDRARLANRLYLRGAPPKIVVNLERVRLTGKERGSSSVRTPRSFADSARVRLSERFYSMLELIEAEPARAMTELALMRVEALQALPDFASALGEVTNAIRGGRDATLALLRARRALNGPPDVRPLSSWSGG